MVSDRLLAQLRGQLVELGGTVADAMRDWNARRLVEEQIQRLGEEVQSLRAEADALKATRFTTQERRDAIALQLVQREAQAVAALQAGHADLAREVAVAIVELERDRDAEDALLGANAERAAQVATAQQRSGNALRRLRHELDLLRAAEAVAHAEASLAQRAGSPGLPTAIDSAERLRARQSAMPDTPASADATASDPLDDRLHAAGVDMPRSPLDAVMDRIAAQAASGAVATPPARSTAQPDGRKDTP